MNLRQPHRNFLTRAEVAQLFEVAPNTVNRWVLAGQLPSVLTPGGRRRYPAAAIMQIIDEQMLGAGAPSPVEQLPRQARGRAEGASQSGSVPLSRPRGRGVANRSRRK